MSRKNRVLSFLKEFPILSQIILSYGIGIVATLIYIIIGNKNLHGLFPGLFVTAFFIGAAFIYPLIITGYQFILFIKALKKKDSKNLKTAYDLWSFLLSLFYEFIYLTLYKEVVFFANWHEQLYNRQIHTPINPDFSLSVMFLLIINIVGFSVLRMKSVNELPPLITVLCISSTYRGLGFILFWTYQISTFERITDFYLLLPCVVTFLIVMRTIVIKVKEFKPDTYKMSKIDSIPILNKLNAVLMDSKNWPVLGFLFMLPILAIVIMILILFGQSPNSLIKAFTETSDWNLSGQTSPQNLYHDEHYLCTVAAGGHKKIVKPLRKGIRHGNTVIVNRQLLVANAFEQILEEKMPKAHKVIRGIYDKYGFPLAKLINSKWMADIIWIIMKPLEWVFLIIIYLCDKHPEDRIAIQYTGKTSINFVPYK